jgi:hypothetical protein
MSHPVRAAGAESGNEHSLWCALHGRQMTFAKGVYWCDPEHGKVVRGQLESNEWVYSCACHGERVGVDNIRLICTRDNKPIACTEASRR